MPPWTNVPLSPSELSYLRTSLASTPPIRPDGRTTPTQFRPLVAETDILPNANGSARICFADGSEAVVGVKAEVEPVPTSVTAAATTQDSSAAAAAAAAGIEVAVEIPGYRDDDALLVFLSEMLCEAILASGGWHARGQINARFRWRLYVDILLLSQPLSYPLPLLSLTTHLALRSARLPALVSTGDEDPLFDDDWEASLPLYARASPPPPVTLLVMSVGANVLFDPGRDELAVADAVVAVSVVGGSGEGGDNGEGDGGEGAVKQGAGLRVVAIRTIDPPSRLTAAGALDAGGGGGGGSGGSSAAEMLAAKEKDAGQSVWRPPRGGLKRQVLSKMLKQITESGGVGEEVLDGLMGVKS